MLKRLRGMFKGRNEGFTLIELLVVVAILGVLGAVAALNIGSFIGTGRVEAANVEAATVRTAVVLYMTEHGGTAPANTRDLSPYLQSSLKGSYTIKSDGTIEGTGGWDGLVWDNTTGKWKKA